MIRKIRIIAAVFLFITAVNAIIAGILFMADPSGQKMGMTTAYLKHSPFATFFIPGLILFIVNGLFNIITLVCTIQNKPYYVHLIFLQGLLLCGWILVQVIMVKDLNVLHIVMFTTGILLILCALFLKNQVLTK